MNGYFDEEKIRDHAKRLNANILAGREDGSFEKAWRKYHDSFSIDQNEVLDDLHASFMRNFNNISPLNLAGTIRLFKDLGRPEQAKEIITHYVKNRKEGRKFFDLDDNPFSDEIDDVDIRYAFTTRLAEIDSEEKFDFVQALSQLNSGLKKSSLAILAKSSVDDYRQAFKSAEGKALRQMLLGALQFDRINNATDEMKEISLRAKEALKLIGRESAINARRVKAYGIILGADAANTAIAEGPLPSLFLSGENLK